MDIVPREVWSYITAEGNSPFEIWITDLKDIQARGAIRARIRRMEFGHFGNWSSVGGGVFEARLNLGPGYRVYFSLYGVKMVILLLGGDKGSQRRDIEKAKAYWQDFRRRGNETIKKLS